MPRSPRLPAQTRRITPTPIYGCSTRGNTPQDDEEQAIAQLLSIDDEVLVCSYLPRTTGQY